MIAFMELTEIFEQMQAKIDSKDFAYEQLEESFKDLALRIDEAGWSTATEFQTDSSGPTIDELHGISVNLRKLTAVNPLLKRGCELRGSYVFGNGITFRNVKPAAQTIIDKPHNLRALFSRQGQEELNKAKFTDGNVFLLYDRVTELCTRVPIDQITDIATNPNDAEDVWWIKRSWLSGENTETLWYRTANLPVKYQKKTKVTSTDPTKIAPASQTMFLETANKQIGWTLGIPDAMAAVLWAMAYSEYLNNNSRLVKAYAAFAMKVTQRTGKGQQNVAGALKQRGERIGATAVQGQGNDLTSMPATGSQVNFNNGQPLAAMVAASLGVSVIALISSPGAAGGSYGAAATLDAPTIIGMSAIQDTWALFYKNFLQHLKSKDVEVEFPAIETDPTYRTIGQLPALIEAGIIHREEARGIVIDLLDVRDPKPSLPELPEQQVEPTSGDNGKDNIEDGDTNNDDRTDLISK